MIAINGICKNWSRLIMCYGLSDSQIDIINKNLPTKESEVMKTDRFTDIIAMPQMVAIMVWDCMSEWDKGSFEDFFSAILPSSETIIVIGNPDIDNELRKQIFVYESFEAFAENIKYKLLNAYRKTKKNDSYSVQLSYALQILKLIYKQPFVTTKQIAEKVEISTRSVQRYIETLRASGEFIYYDRGRKGWVADPDLLDDENKSMYRTLEMFKKEPRK